MLIGFLLKLVIADSRQEEAFCYHGGMMYKAKESWKSSPCTICVCNSDGKVQCNEISCANSNCGGAGGVGSGGPAETLTDCCLNCLGANFKKIQFLFRKFFTGTNETANTTGLSSVADNTLTVVLTIVVVVIVIICAICAVAFWKFSSCRKYVGGWFRKKY